MTENVVDKDGFYKYILPYFESGVLKEIYSSDELCICNVSNAAYLCTNFLMTKYGPYVVFINQNDIKKIVENNNYFYNIIDGMTDDKLDKYSTILNKKSYENFVNIKQETDLKGPTVNLEYENELLQKIQK